MKEHSTSSCLHRTYQAPQLTSLRMRSEAAFLTGSREELGDLDPTKPTWDPED